MSVSTNKKVLVARVDPRLTPWALVWRRFAALRFLLRMILFVACSNAPFFSSRLRWVAGPLRVFFWSHDLAVAHMNNAITIGSCFGIVRDHQDGLAEFPVGVA